MPNGYRRFFLLVTCGLLLPGAGARAQVNSPTNEVGIFTVQNPDGCATAQIEVPVATPFTCYLVLANPWNENLDHAIATVGGFEFHIEVPAEAYLLNMTLPVPSTWWPEGPDVMVGTEAPVVGNQCTLMTLSLMTTTTAPVFVYLTPVQNAPQTIPGEMAFTDFDDDFSVHVMHPISGSPDVPVFAINWDGDLSFCETVPDEGMAFGAVKALYR